MMPKTVLIISLLLLGCSHTPKENPKEKTFSECARQQEDLRREKYLQLPENMRALAGSHPIVKYYSYSPSVKELLRDSVALDRENKSFDARTEESSKGVDPRLLDTSPGRNRLFIHFEKQRQFRFGPSKEVTLFRVDYGNPAIPYKCPIESFENKNSIWSCRLSGTVTAQKSLDGNPLSFKYDFKMRVIPVGEKYLYFEWLSTGDKMESDLSADHYTFRALVYTQSEDRFYKWEHPYFDPTGDLNPEVCAELQGG
jgi:hypothetical protein